MVATTDASDHGRTELEPPLTSFPVDVKYRNGLSLLQKANTILPIVSPLVKNIQPARPVELDGEDRTGLAGTLAEGAEPRDNPSKTKALAALTARTKGECRGWQAGAW